MRLTLITYFTLIYCLVFSNAASHGFDPEKHLGTSNIRPPNGFYQARPQFSPEVWIERVKKEVSPDSLPILNPEIRTINQDSYLNGYQEYVPNVLQHSQRAPPQGFPTQQLTLMHNGHSMPSLSIQTRKPYFDVPAVRYEFNQNPFESTVMQQEQSYLPHRYKWLNEMPITKTVPGSFIPHIPPTPSKDDTAYNSLNNHKRILATRTEDLIGEFRLPQVDPVKTEDRLLGSASNPVETKIVRPLYNRWLSNPNIKNVLSATKHKKRYLVIHPNGTVEHVDTLESVTKSNPNYVLLHAGDLVAKPTENIQKLQTRTASALHDIKTTGGSDLTKFESRPLETSTNENHKPLTPILPSIRSNTAGDDRHVLIQSAKVTSMPRNQSNSPGIEKVPVTVKIPESLKNYTRNNTNNFVEIIQGSTISKIYNVQNATSEPISEQSAVRINTDKDQPTVSNITTMPTIVSPKHSSRQGTEMVPIKEKSKFEAITDKTKKSTPQHKNITNEAKKEQETPILLQTEFAKASSASNIQVVTSKPSPVSPTFVATNNNDKVLLKQTIPALNKQSVASKITKLLIAVNNLEKNATNRDSAESHKIKTPPKDGIIANITHNDAATKFPKEILILNNTNVPFKTNISVPDGMELNHQSLTEKEKPKLVSHSKPIIIYGVNKTSNVPLQTSSFKPKPIIIYGANVTKDHLMNSTPADTINSSQGIQKHNKELRVKVVAETRKDPILPVVKVVAETANRKNNKTNPSSDILPTLPSAQSEHSQQKKQMIKVSSPHKTPEPKPKQKPASVPDSTVSKVEVHTPSPIKLEASLPTNPTTAATSVREPLGNKIPKKPQEHEKTHDEIINKTPNDANSHKNANNRPLKSADDYTFNIPGGLDISKVKSKEKPAIWLRTKDGDLFDKLIGGSNDFDIVYFFQITNQPRIESDTTRTIHPNGTIIEETTKTVWESGEGPPVVTKTTKFINPDEKPTKKT